ncbi:MAG: PD40 domain-containing protein [Ignavibacteriales bacterium]|nr:PD40 domain-containing protein [Ignavibacteriales bacterium]
MRRRKFILAASLVVVLSVAGYLYFSNKGVELNPNFTSRWIRTTTSKIAGMPGLSPDGKWIVFAAPDEKAKWDLYVISTAGGEARRLTSDSTFAYAQNVSPDGSRIVYERRPPDATSGNVDICIVPFNGGTSMKIGAGRTPKWSPDGSRIGYLRSTPGKYDFWTMKSDGTENRLVHADSGCLGAEGTWAFAWSPVGTEIAWVHPRGRNHSEIMICNLAEQSSRSVISDNTFKNEICWTPNNQLIYSSAVGEEMNLWMVPVTGGTPLQITKGLGSVDYPMISKDGHTLLYYQARTTGHLWLAQTDGSDLRKEVYSAEQYFEYPDLSPDGTSIAFGMTLPLGVYSFGTRQLFVMNRDGTDLRQITSGNDDCYGPRWSPDGKMMAYYARGKHEPTDSFKVYVVNPHKLDVPRFVGYGTDQSWVDSVTLEMTYKTRSWRGYLDGRPAKPFGDDSIFCTTVGGGQFVVFTDVHGNAVTGKIPSKVCRIEDWDGAGPRNSITLPVRGGYPNYDAYYNRVDTTLRRLSYRDWKLDTLEVYIQGIDLNSFFIRTTADGKEMIYKTTETVNKLGVIENLFK